MATTTNGIYYPNDYDSVADIPADMKKIAESVDTKIAENKTEINNIKTEQTTQNTNISNLQKDNTTNKQDITNIKAKDTEQDKYIAELEAENTRLRQDLNGLPKGQASGESIDLNDSAEMRCELKISGNSVQDTTPILPTEYEPYGASPSPDYPSDIKTVGSNVNIYDKETMPLKNGLWIGDATIAGNSKGNYVVVPIIGGKTYTISKKNTTGGIYATTTANNPQNREKVIDKWDGASGFTSYTIKTSSTAKYLFVGLFAGAPSAEEKEKCVEELKVEEGTVATPWSPYGQGCINEVICNDNLFDKNNLIPYTVIPRSNGVAITNNSSNYEPYNATDFIPVKENTNYFINFTFASTNYGWCFYDKNKNFISGIEPNVKSFATPKETAYLRFCYDKNRIGTNTIQLVEGSTEKPYVEHKEQIYTIPTQRPFRAIGNVRDKFILKENGKWYERHYIARKIFDGTENFNLGTNANSLIYFFTNAGSIKAKSQDLLCNKLTTVTNLWNETENKNLIAIRSALDLFNIMLSDTTINTVDLFKSYLQEQYNAGTPVYVDYIAETPTDIECTEEQSTILFDIEQNAKTYDKVTHMYSTDNVSPVIDVTYKKDIETLFANTLVEGV